MPTFIESVWIIPDVGRPLGQRERFVVSGEEYVCVYQTGSSKAYI